MKEYVSYIRVSTQKQGVSGLGLQSQVETVNKYISNNGVVIAEFKEIESGKNNKRPELLKALELCKRTKATLVVAKLDRLSRNASFTIALRDSNINFVCCDMPDANNFTIGLFSLLAEQERQFISSRTKNALQSKKNNGFKLGSPKNLTDLSRKKSLETRQEKAINNSNNKRAFALIESDRKQNLSYNQIAKKLNDSDFKTSKGGIFTAMQVKRIFDMYSK